MEMIDIIEPTNSWITQVDLDVVQPTLSSNDERHNCSLTSRAANHVAAWESPATVGISVVQVTPYRATQDAALILRWPDVQVGIQRE